MEEMVNFTNVDYKQNDSVLLYEFKEQEQLKISLEAKVNKYEASLAEKDKQLQVVYNTTKL